MLKSLRIKNLLSFGPDGVDVELRPLNVLIGPNGSGKTNFIEVIRLLQAAPTDLGAAFRANGCRIEDWAWSNSIFPSIIEIIAGSDIFQDSNYLLSFLCLSPSFEVFEEQFKTDTLHYFYRHREKTKFNEDFLASPSVRQTNSDKSVFSEYKDGRATDFSLFSYHLQKIKIYSDRPNGRSSVTRQPQRVDIPNDFVSEKFDNLAVVLHTLNNRINIDNLLLTKLQRFYPRAERIYTDLLGGGAQVFIKEKAGTKTIDVPATRLSDGTLSILCLLTILLHPSPPPLICLEEPELGLHPDVLSVIAELLVEASKRTQIIVTTHSDILVSHIGQHDPEAILVCEHDSEMGTQLKRPNPELLKNWLADDEDLGSLWLRGAIGGTLY